MPIPRKKLLQALKSPDARILEFLQEHKDQAYSLIEIVAEIENYKDEITLLLFGAMEHSEASIVLDPYRKAVERLVKSSRIVEASHQGIPYYAIQLSR